MTALTAAVSRRPRWEHDAAVDAARMSTGTSCTEAENPTGPWALVIGVDDGWAWRAFPAGLDGRPLGKGCCRTLNAAMDAAERAVDAVVAR